MIPISFSGIFRNFDLPQADSCQCISYRNFSVAASQPFSLPLSPSTLTALATRQAVPPFAGLPAAVFRAPSQELGSTLVSRLSPSALKAQSQPMRSKESVRSRLKSSVSKKPLGVLGLCPRFSLPNDPAFFRRSRAKAILH